MNRISRLILAVWPGRSKAAAVVALMVLLAVPAAAQVKPPPAGIHNEGFAGAPSSSTDASPPGSASGAACRPFVPKLVPHVADANHPAIALTRGHSTGLLLENDDSTTHDLTWVYRLVDESSSVKDRLANGPPTNDSSVNPGGNATIPPGGAEVLTIEPPREWFTGAGPFKDDVADGYLSVHVVAPAGCMDPAAAPTKAFPFATTLVGYEPGAKAAYTYVTVFILLLAGAFCSLYVNYKFPDDKIRKALRQRLDNLGQTIGSLSMKLASRLRVVAGVERLALRDQLLLSLVWWSADFDAARSRIDASVGKLEKRVDVLERMGRLREAFEDLGARRVPPTLLDRLEGLFEDTVRSLAVLAPSDDDVHLAEVNLAEITKALALWYQPELAPPQEMQLAELFAARLRRVFADTKAGGSLAGPDWQALVGKVPGTGALGMPPPDAKDIDPGDYHEWDWLGSIGCVLRDHLRLVQQRNPAPGDRLLARQTDLVRMLQTRTWDSITSARRLVAEMTSEIYAEDVDGEIVAKRGEIVADNGSVHCFEPCQFTIRFDDRRFDSADARDEWVVEWNFGHVPLGQPDQKRDYLKEKGWSVAHYFPSAQRYTVQATLRPARESATAGGVDQKRTLTKDLSVSEAGNQIRRRRANWLADNLGGMASFSMALVPAIFALVAGGKDQLLKMDTLPAFIAVFLAGFGSDQVKSLLAKSGK